jgi:hypothetical protein
MYLNLWFLVRHFAYFGSNAGAKTRRREKNKQQKQGCVSEEWVTGIRGSLWTMTPLFLTISPTKCGFMAKSTSFIKKA